MKINRLILCLCLSLCLLVTGCQGVNNWLFDPEPVPAETSPSPSLPPSPPSGPAGNDLFGVPWTPGDTVRPLAGDTRQDEQWQRLVYEGLFALDGNFEPVSVLCESFETEDNRLYLFTLRAGVTFHDGSLLTAADAVASLEAARKFTSPYASRLAGIASARALDDLTLEVKTSAPNPRLPALLTLPVLPADSGALPVAPGTGPYVPQIDDEHPHLSAYAGWWQQKTLPVNRIELVSAGTPDRLIYAFETRAASLIEQDPKGTSAVYFGGDYETWEFDTTVLQFLGFNTKKPPMDNPAVRRALAAAVDRAALCRELYENRWAVSAGLPVPPRSPLYDETLAGQYGYDLVRLSELFVELGLEDKDEDGVLEYPLSRYRRQPMVFTLLVNSENTIRVEAARMIARALEGVGVSVAVEEKPFSAYKAALEKGEFDLYYAETTLSADFDPTVFFAGGTLGYGQYKNAETSALWNAAASAPYGTGAAAVARRAFWKRWLEETPVVPVLFTRQALLTQRGLVSDPRPLWGNLFYHFTEWDLKG